MADAGAIKTMNIETVRKALLERGEMSKTAIARETGLSFPTISRAVDSLVLTGELTESGVEQSTGGRCAKVYALNTKSAVTLSVRIEPGMLHWFLSDLTGERLEFDSFPAIDGILPTLDSMCDDLLERFPQLSVITVGLCGILSGGTVLVAFGCPELEGIDLHAHISQKIKGRILIETERSLAALGVLPETDPPRSLVALHIGQSGISSGVVIDGSIWHGLSSFSGELAFLPAVHNQELATNDPIGYYAEIIQCFVSLLAPESVVFFGDTLPSESIPELLTKLSERLPEPALPALSVEEDFFTAYERGLARCARALLSEKK